MVAGADESSAVPRVPLGLCTTRPGGYIVCDMKTQGLSRASALVQALPMLVLLVLVAGCAPVAVRPPPAPPPAMVRFHGSVVYQGAGSLPPGATLIVSLYERGTVGTRVLAHSSPVPASGSPQAFVLEVPESLLRDGHFYVLRALINDAAGRPLWIQAAPAPVDVAVASRPVTLWLINMAASLPKPASRPLASSQAVPSGPPVLVADGIRPTWAARIYGIGGARQLRTSVGADAPLRQSYRGVSRQRLASGVVVYATADGFVTLTISPGNCRLLARSRSMVWHAILETPAATYRGCASGIP